MEALGTEAIGAAAYAAFLAVGALGLDRLARHAHHRSARHRTAGFDFRGDLDAWVCPEGEHLRRVETDLERRLARYRARPAVCNACPAKPDCTDSDEGREIARPLDPWPHSEAGRFHRGLAVAMVGLAVLILAVALVRNHDPADIVLLGSLLVAVGALLVSLWSEWRRIPDSFDASPPSPA